MLPEFSRFVALQEVARGRDCLQTIVAQDAERRALAVRLGVAGLDSLEAEVVVRYLHHPDLLEVRGRLTAQVRQVCVISLESVVNQVGDSFTVLLTTNKPSVSPVEVAWDEHEIEPLEHDGIDIGELTSQYLVLALDPYPRRVGSSFVSPVVVPERAEPADDPGHPFAALGRLRVGSRGGR